MAAKRPSRFLEVAKWAAEYHMRELESGQEPGLNPTHQKAFDELHRAIQPPPPFQASTDWVSLLKNYGDSKPGFSMIFAEEPVSVGNGPLTWVMIVTITDQQDPFPGPAHGLLPNGGTPSFAGKKAAKQYAAQCAVEWLLAQNLMFLNGTAAKPLRSKPGTPSMEPVAKKQKIQPSDTSRPALGSEAGALKLTDTSAERQTSVLSRMADQCKRLGVQVPSFHLEQDEVGLWTGFPKWGEPNLSCVPYETGFVKNIETKDAAEQMMAEDVVKQLSSKEAKRNEVYQEIFGVNWEDVLKRYLP